MMKSYLTHVTRPTHKRRRMELSIRFRIRTEQAKDLCPRPIMITLRMDGRKLSDYNSGVKVRPPKWSQKDQMMIGRNKVADEINERLAQIDLQHRDILRELKRRFARGEGPRPTPELVKAEFLRPGSTSPTLLELYDSYLSYLDTMDGTEDGRSEKTLQRAHKTRDHILHFENPTYQKGDTPKSVQLIDLTTGWGKRFHSWLQLNPKTTTRRMQKDTANKYLAHVRDALDYAIDEGLISTNALDKFRPKRGKGKPIYFLSRPQIDKLMSLEADDPQLQYTIWWCRLMCLTGLDYKDAIRYARERKTYEHKSSAGYKIVIDRSKKNAGSCEIPVLPQLKVLFSVYPTGPHDPELADLNRHLRKVISPLIGFKEEVINGHLQKLTSKILRKSAGALFLHIGYTLEAVSRFLGHSSVRVTQEHYVSITSSYVDAEMARVAKFGVET